MYLKDALVSVLSLEAAPRGDRDSPRHTPTKLASFFHGRKSSRSTLTPASQGAVNSLPPSSHSNEGKLLPSPGIGNSLPPSSHSSDGRQHLHSRSTVHSKPPSSHSNEGRRLAWQPALQSTGSTSSRMSATIRSVRSFEDHPRDSEDSSCESSSLAASRTSAFSSSINSTASAMSSISQSQAPEKENAEATVRLKPSITTNGTDGSTPTLEVTRPSSPRRRSDSSRPKLHVPQRDSSLSTSTIRSSVEPPSSTTGETPSSTTETSVNGWDSTVGKAGLGKTGRVINRLVSDNEALKRDIKIERLRAEESQQAARLLKDKMERLASEHEGRLLEANVTKTLLARKERQVESLQAAVETERARAADAGARERTWREEMERVRADAKRDVDEATAHAALVDGRYNAISSHWREQGDEVARAMGKMRGEVAELVAERVRDDQRIDTLQDLCDQQDGNIRELKRQKEEVAREFERYKMAQEEALREIKESARRREEEQERMIEESREVLDKLKWALNVRDNVKGAG